jgi:hypothetical protein
VHTVGDIDLGLMRLLRKYAMNRKSRVSEIALSFLLVAVALLVVACVRPVDNDSADELELEEAAVFNPTSSPTEVPVQPTSIPPTEVVELPTTVVEPEPTLEPTPEPTLEPTPEPTPIPSSIIISSPLEGSLLDVSGDLVISGTGEGLPEGNVSLHVIDDEDNILLTASTVLIGDSVGTGGLGTWALTVTVAIELDQPGSIYAFSTSQGDGAIVAEDTIDVLFFQSVREPFIEIDSPVEGSVVAESPFLVSGRGGGLFEGNVIVNVEDVNGNILLTQFAILQGENVGIGGSGTWELSISLSVFLGTPVHIVAFSTSPEDGSVIANAAVDVIFGETTGSVIHLVQLGETLYRISLAYGVSMEAIMAANGLPDADNIYAGQQLIIPQPSP